MVGKEILNQKSGLTQALSFLEIITEIPVSLVKEKLSTGPTQARAGYLSLPIFPQPLTSVNKCWLEKHTK